MGGLLLGAAGVLGFVAPGAAAPEAVFQTNWKILSATGTSTFVAAGNLLGEPGPGDDWSFDAEIAVTWRQTATNARRPGARVVSFNFASMRARPQLNPIRDVAATVQGRITSQTFTRSGSCRFGAPVDRGYFANSAANELFLSSRAKGRDLIAYVQGQAPRFAFPRAPCATVDVPVFVDETRERITPIALSKIEKTKPCAKTSLTLFRTAPVVEDGQTVGQLTEKAKLTLQVPKYVNGREVRCK